MNKTPIKIVIFFLKLHTLKRFKVLHYMGSTSNPLYNNNNNKKGLQMAIQHLPPPPPPYPPPSPFCVPKSTLPGLWTIHRLWTTHKHNPMQCTSPSPLCWLESCCSNHKMHTHFHGCPTAHFTSLFKGSQYPSFGVQHTNTTYTVTVVKTSTGWTTRYRSGAQTYTATLPLRHRHRKFIYSCAAALNRFTEKWLYWHYAK